jgi:hypothetical protein
VKAEVPALAQFVTDLQDLKFKEDGDLAQATLEINFASLEGMKSIKQGDWNNVAVALGKGLVKQGGLAQGSGPDKPADDKGSGDKPTTAPADDNIPEGFAEGQRAPDIDGKDIDGKDFKLSEYRGKVILLDFWGHW